MVTQVVSATVGNEHLIVTPFGIKQPLRGLTTHRGGEQVSRSRAPGLATIVRRRGADSPPPELSLWLFALALRDNLVSFLQLMEAPAGLGGPDRLPRICGPQLACPISKPAVRSRRCPQRSPAACPCAAGGDGRMAKSARPLATVLASFPLCCRTVCLTCSAQRMFLLSSAMVLLSAKTELVCCACRKRQQSAAARRLRQHRRRHAQQRERVHSRQPAGRLWRRGPRGRAPA